MEVGTQTLRKRGSLVWLRKYKAVASNEWNRVLSYRFTVLSFRLSNVVDILAQVFMWSVFFSGGIETVGGYTYNEMITYIMFGYLFSFLTTNYEYETVLARQIQRGELNNLIIKPFKFVTYYMFIAFGRMGVTFFTSMVMQFVFIMIFWKFMVMPENVLAFSGYLNLNSRP